MHTQGRNHSFLLAVVLAVAFSLSFGLTPVLAEDCPCFGGVDNFCFYPASTSGCSMTYPGGYCDPNGDGDYSDGDWVRGYFEYQDACPGGGPPPPPPPGDDDDDDDSSDYSPWIYGIHWYGDNTGSDVEAMTGGKKIWVLETATIWDGWTISDQLQKFQTIADRGHTLIIRIQPRWGWSIPAPGTERAQYLDAVEAAAQQAKNVCHIWQIGNEMNLYSEYGGGVLSAPEYIEFFKQIRQRIRNVSSPLGPQIVLVGPVSPGAYFQEVRHTDGLQYLDQMCDLLNADDFDGFALHAYGAFWEDANGARWDFQNGSGGYAAQLDVIDGNGFFDKPAFILEFNRQTPDEDAWQESQTAQFIIGAYQDLQTWNGDPGHHPIICATWFIYADVGGWEIFSLRHLRDKNSRGVNQDVWDSFQYACSLNIPAGDVDTGVPPPPPPPPVDDLNGVHINNTLPDTVQPGQTVNVSVTVKNTGSPTWRASSGDRLGTGGDNAFVWTNFADGGYSNAANDQRAYLSGTEAIATDDTKTFSFSIAAPSQPGQYQFSARMVREGVTWYGETVSKMIMVEDPAPPPPSEQLAAKHVADTIPETLQAGQTVQVTVTLENIGALTWRASTGDRLGAGGDNAFVWSNFADGGYSNATGDQRVYLSGSDAIATDNSKVFTFSIQAPSVAGQYTFSGRMVRDGVAWYGEVVTQTVTVTAVGASSLTNGEPRGTFGSGGQTDEITEPENWRWSEWYYGFQGIDRIEWRSDACGQNHNYVIGWHQNDLIEYLMKVGGEYRYLTLRGLADHPGPVEVEVYVDGNYAATARWNNSDDCNQDMTVEIPAIAFGTHAVAIQFVNDYFDPGTGEDRNFYLDGLKVVSQGDPALTWAYPLGAADNADGWYVSNPLGNSWYSSQNQRWYRGHLGEDWFKTGDSSYGEPVYAAAEGKVVTVLNNCGNYLDVVIIEHEVPEFREPIYSFYGHLETDGYVQEGERVLKRQQIGTLGDPISFLPHLHFEIKNRTARVNPPFSNCSDIANGVYISAGYSGISNDYDDGDYYDPSDEVVGNRYYHPRRFIEKYK